MKTKVEDNTSYICLDSKLPKFGGGRDYNESFKLHYDHYQKVLKAKMEKGLISPTRSPEEREELRIPEREMKEGDFVYLSGLTNMARHYGKPVYGWVLKDENGKLYVQSHKLVYYQTKRGNDYSFIPEKYYLKKPDGTQSAAYMSYKILFSKCNVEVLQSV